MNANLFRLLQLDQQYSDDVLESSGVSQMIEEARRRRVELLDEGASLLEPLGLRRSDLENLLQERIETADDVESLIGPDQQTLPIRVDGEQLSLGHDG